MKRCWRWVGHTCSRNRSRTLGWGRVHTTTSSQHLPKHTHTHTPARPESQVLLPFAPNTGRALAMRSSWATEFTQMQCGGGAACLLVCVWTRRRNPVHSQIAPEVRQGQRRALRWGANIAAVHFTPERDYATQRARKRFSAMNMWKCVCAKLMNEYRRRTHKHIRTHVRRSGYS